MTDEQKKPSKLAKLLKEKATLDLKIELERRKKLREDGEVFETVEAMLAHFFPGHKIIKQGEDFYLDEIEATRKVKINKDRLSGLLDMMEQLKDEVSGHRKADEPPFIAPPHYRCHHCGIVVGDRISKMERTIGHQPLCGHDGANLHCRICNANLGPDPMSIHAYS